MKIVPGEAAPSSCIAAGWEVMSSGRIVMTFGRVLNLGPVLGGGTRLAFALGNERWSSLSALIMSNLFSYLTNIFQEDITSLKAAD